MRMGRRKNFCWTWMRYLDPRFEIPHYTDFLSGSIARLWVASEKLRWKLLQMARLLLCLSRNPMKKTTPVQVLRCWRPVELSKSPMEVRKRGTRRAENELYVIPRCIDITIIELRLNKKGKIKVIHSPVPIES